MESGVSRAETGLDNSRLLSSICVSMFFIGLSMGTFLSLLPLYALHLGASYVDLGLIGTVWSVSYTVFPPLVGMMTDRFGRRKFMLAGMGCFVLSPALYLLASRVWHVIVIQAVNGAVQAFIWPVVQAFLVDITTPSERTRVMSRYSSSWILGTLIGPTIGGIVLQNYGFIALFTLSSILAVLGLVTFLPTSLEARHFERRRHVSCGLTQAFRDVAAILLHPIYIAIVTYSIAVSLIYNIFPAYVKTLGANAFQIGILFTVFGVVRTLSSWRSEGVRSGRESMLVVSALTVQGVSLIMMAYPRNFTPFLALTASIGFSVGTITPLTLSVLSKTVPEERAGLAMGMAESVVGAGWIIGPLVGGAIAQYVGPSHPYTVFGAVTLLMIPVILLRCLKLPKNSYGG